MFRHCDLIRLVSYGTCSCFCILQIMLRYRYIYAIFNAILKIKHTFYIASGPAQPPSPE